MLLLAVKIIGWWWSLQGLWWTLRPEGARRRVARGFRKTLRRLVFLTLTGVGALLFSLGWQTEGLLGKALPVAGLLAVGNGLVFLRSQLTDRFLNWWEERPTWMYRAAALCFAAAGFVLQWVAGLTASE